MVATKSALLRKTCISNMPVEDIKEHGDRFIITISDTPCELMMVDMERVAYAVESIDRYEEDEKKLLKIILHTHSKDYNISETGSTAYIGREFVSLLGKPGDKVQIVYEGEGVWKIKGVSTIDYC